MLRQRVNREKRFPGGGVETAFARRIGQIKAGRLAHAAVVILKARNDARNFFAYAVVIFYEPFPINGRFRSEHCACKMRDDGRFA